MFNTLFGTVVLTILSLLAFAANSVLCRMALGDEAIDAASFTLIRLLSGIITLLLISFIQKSHKTLKARGSWSAAFMLFAYALCFSYAYVRIDTATGALILFAFVQITMIVVSVCKGVRLHSLEWAGLLLAFVGFVYLVLPNVHSPSLWGFGLMAIAGVAWGLYTLEGRASLNPIADTTANFLRTAPFLIVLGGYTFQYAHLSANGLWSATASGALASGVGYIIWYTALRNLSNTLAASVQLLVPVIAALGGVIFYNENLSLRLFLSFSIVLGGISIILIARHKIKVT